MAGCKLARGSDFRIAASTASRSRTSYRSDVYSVRGSAYYPIVVWQFWGRAAEAS